MAKVLIPLPRQDFDPSEAAVSWSVLKQHGHSIAFATPDGRPGAADDMMLTGEGLDVWGFLPGIKRIAAIGRLMRANADARTAYARMQEDPAYRAPLLWSQLRCEDFDGLLLPGGHRARGMREYLESETLQRLVAAFFAAGLPVAAICHGVLLAARSRGADSRSVLFGRRTTALTWALERGVARRARRSLLGPELLSHVPGRAGKTGRLHVGRARSNARAGERCGFPRRVAERSGLPAKDQWRGARHVRERASGVRGARRQLHFRALARGCAHLRQALCAHAR